MADRGRTTPERVNFAVDARETLALARRSDQTINVVLVALTDGIELEVWADGLLRRRMRFLRDAEARKHCDRVCARLARRGYVCEPPGPAR